MASALFDILSARLEEETDLIRLEARGTLRIAFRHGGVDIECFTRAEVSALFTRILPAELTQRGVAEPEAVCTGILDGLDEALFGESEAAASLRDETFRRLGEG